MAAPDYGIPSERLRAIEFDEQRQRATFDDLEKRKARLREILAQQTLGRMSGMGSPVAQNVINQRGTQDRLTAELAFGKARLNALEQEQELARHYAGEAGR